VLSCMGVSSFFAFLFFFPFHSAVPSPFFFFPFRRRVDLLPLFFGPRRLLLLTASRSVLLTPRLPPVLFCGFLENTSPVALTSTPFFLGFRPPPAILFLPFFFFVILRRGFPFPSAVSRLTCPFSLLLPSDSRVTLGVRFVLQGFFFRFFLPF